MVYRLEYFPSVRFPTFQLYNAEAADLAWKKVMGFVQIFLVKDS